MEDKLYNSVLEITRLHSFISGNTCMGTRHLYWILTGLSFAMQGGIEYMFGSNHSIYTKRKGRRRREEFRVEKHPMYRNMYRKRRREDYVG